MLYIYLLRNFSRYKKNTRYYSHNSFNKFAEHWPRKFNIPEIQRLIKWLLYSYNMN